MLRLIIFIISLITLYSCNHKRVASIEYLLASSEHPIIKKVISDPDKYELQIRYTAIDRSSAKTSYTHYDYRVDSTQYFYPASTVKMPTAFAAVEFINELSNSNVPIDIYTPMKIDSTRTPHRDQSIDSCTSSGLPTVAGFVKEIFTISDNGAYNQLYSLINQSVLNEKLYSKGAFTNSHITSRVGVSGYNDLENTFSKTIKFMDGDLAIFSLIGDQYKFDYTSDYNDCLKGLGYIDANDSLVMQPFDMCTKNFVSIQDLESTLMRIIDPYHFKPSERFAINEKDREYILNCMKTLPREVPCYKNNPNYTDNYCKFLMYGDDQHIPENIEIYNKIGLAYGYLTDCAYIKDTENNIDFFLTCTMSVNENQIYNDGIYEYDEVGLPFMAELGKIIYRHELENKK